MTSSQRVKSQLFESNENLIRLAPPAPAGPLKKRRIRIRRRAGAKKNGEPWTQDEHERFLVGLEAYPSGPWKVVAAFVMTRTTRQTMTHAQKYRQKIERRQRVARDSPSTSVGVAALASSSTHEESLNIHIPLLAGGGDSVARAPSPKHSEVNFEFPRAKPIKSEAGGISALHHSASLKAIDALLNNWHSILSIESETSTVDLSNLDRLDADTISF